LDPQRRRHENQRCCDGHVELTVDGVFRDRDTAVSEASWSLVPQTTVDAHSKLELHPMCHIRPVQIIVKQL